MAYTPRYYNITCHEPYAIQKLVIANGGQAKLLRAILADKSGAIRKIAFRLVPAVTVLTWKAASENGSAITVGTTTGFILPGNEGIAVSNEFDLKDVSIDNCPSLFDYWRGTVTMVEQV